MIMVVCACASACAYGYVLWLCGIPMFTRRKPFERSTIYDDRTISSYDCQNLLVCISEKCCV